MSLKEIESVRKHSDHSKRCVPSQKVFPFLTWENARRGMPGYRDGMQVVFDSRNPSDLMVFRYSVFQHEKSCKTSKHTLVEGTRAPQRKGRLGVENRNTEYIEVRAFWAGIRPRLRG